MRKQCLTQRLTQHLTSHLPVEVFPLFLGGHRSFHQLDRHLIAPVHHGLVHCTAAALAYPQLLAAGILQDLHVIPAMRTIGMV